MKLHWSKEVGDGGGGVGAAVPKVGRACRCETRAGPLCSVGYNGAYRERSVGTMKQIWDGLIVEHPIASVIGALLVVVLTCGSAG